MAAPEYTTDLQDVNLAEADTDWIEIPSRKGGGAVTLEDRAYIQGDYCISQAAGTATGRTIGLQYDYGSNISWTSGHVFTIWQFWQAPYAIGTWADGGMRFGVGSSGSDVNLWNTQGNDYGRLPYGGYSNVAVDPEYAYDEQVGSPTAGNYRYFWSAPYILTAVDKGNPHCVDAIRWGRGEIIVASGESGNSGTFENMSQRNDSGENRWGLFQEQAGSYLWKGLMSFGTTGAAVDFRDENRVITVDDTPRTYNDFNKIEINHASSRVDWSAISFTSIGLTSPGNFEQVGQADLNIEGCSFTNMGTFVFKNTAVTLTSIFRNCGRVQQSSSTITGCTFSGCTGEVALYVDDIDKITDCIFESSGTGHAVEYAPTTPGPFNVYWDGNQDSGYAATDGSTGNETILIHPSNNSATITLNVVNGATTPTVMEHGDYTGTFTKVINPVTTTITVRDVISNALIEDARVYVEAADGSGELPYLDSVSITQSGEVATVNHSTHGLDTDNWVRISGCNEQEYNISAQITESGENYYLYDITGNPTSPATGSPKSTGVIFNELTVTGEVTDIRAFGSDQNITGRVRRSSTSPLYKTQPVTGTIDKDSGVSITVLLIPDE